MRDTSDCEEQEQHPVEIALIGDMTESESEMTDRLLSVRPGGECTIYFDSPGGSPYKRNVDGWITQITRHSCHGNCDR